MLGFTAVTTFFSSKLGKVIIALALLAAIIGTIYSGMLYVSNLKSEVTRLEGENTTLVTTIEEQVKEAERTEKELKEINDSKRSLQRTINVLVKQQNSLQKKFDKVKMNGTKRDIGYIAYKKPELFTKIINKATGYALRCAELASGSPLTENDLKNTECAELIQLIQGK